MPTIEEINIKRAEEGYTDEALKSDVTLMINEAVKAKAEAFESSLTELGYDKTDGVSGIDHMVNTVNTLKKENVSLVAKSTELETQVAQLSDKVPDIKKIEADFNKKLVAKETEIATLKTDHELFNLRVGIEKAAMGLDYEPTLQDAAAKLLKAETSDIMTLFDVIEVDGVSILQKKGTGVSHRMEDNTIATVENYLKTAMGPFLKKPGSKTPPQTPPGDEKVFKTDSEVMEYANKNGINWRTKEGQAEIQKLKAKAKA